MDCCKFVSFNLDYFLFVLLVNSIWSNDRNKINPSLWNPIKCLWKSIFSFNKLSTFFIKTQSISISISFLFDWVWHPKTLIKFYACAIYLNGKGFFGSTILNNLNRNLHSNRSLFLPLLGKFKLPKNFPKLYRNCENKLLDIIISPWKMKKNFPSKHFDYECVKTSTWIKLNIDNFPRLLPTISHPKKKT